jgi:1-acyl-sn-glycerol-3-phosphate acyltransferase
MKHLVTKISQTIHGCAAITLLSLSTMIMFIPVLLFGVLKLFPNKTWRRLCTRGVDHCATFWIMFNNAYLNLTHNVDWQVQGLENLNRKNWYLVISNHQTWLDIVVLQKIFNRKIPVLKFFVKDQLKWVPLLGFAWWAMGCPFMKRYSREYIKKNPAKKGQDLAETKKACELFKKMPVAIMNFVEGTRFTHKKQRHQSSPYTNLLIPKAGGVAFVINALGQKLTSIVDVTIIYPQKNKTLWDFLCRRVNTIKVFIRTIPIPEKFIHTDYIENSTIQADFKQWINHHWAQKDLLIQQEG